MASQGHGTQPWPKLGDAVITLKPSSLHLWPLCLYTLTNSVVPSNPVLSVSILFIFRSNLFLTTSTYKQVRNLNLLSTSRNSAIFKMNFWDSACLQCALRLVLVDAQEVYHQYSVNASISRLGSCSPISGQRMSKLVGKVGMSHSLCRTFQEISHVHTDCTSPNLQCTVAMGRLRPRWPPKSLFCRSPKLCDSQV